MDASQASQHKVNLVARIVEYRMPPFRDALIMGREALIGCHAMRRALTLLSKTPFLHTELDDDIISDILVRENILRRISREQLIAFVMSHIKPQLGIDEILQVEIEPEVTIILPAP
jgi:hypothetical protein